MFPGKEKLKESLHNLKIAVTLGGRSYGWDFTKHFKLVESQSYLKNQLPWLQKLAQVITRGKNTVKKQKLIK